MPRLLALIPEDGWALVRDADTIFFIRPPFRKSERIPVSAVALADAIAVHGYQSQDDAPEEPWANVVERVYQRMVRLDTTRNLPSNAELLSRFVNSCPRPMLSGLLDKVENEWLAKGDLRTAHRAISALLGADRVKDDNPLLQRASLLSQRLHELRDEKEARVPVRTRPDRIDAVASRPSVIACKAKLRHSGVARMVGMGA